MVTTSRMIINLVANNLDAGKSSGHRAPAQKLCHSQQNVLISFYKTQEVGQSSVPELKRYYQCTIKEFASSREKATFTFEFNAFARISVFQGSEKGSEN